MQALAGGANVKPLSFLTPIGYQSGSCGYCKGPSSSQRTPNSRASYYAVTKLLDVEHYQELVDRGWRRSGTLLYKPDVLRSCCPHYTIRLPAASFKPKRDQRQAINRWNRYVIGDAYYREAARLRPKSKEEKARQRNDFDLIETVHESEYDRIAKPPEPEHRFEVTREPDVFTEEKFKLYANYQEVVHHDTPSEITRSGFKRFLCGSPLQRTSRDLNGTTQHLGSFHQCYRLDGRLIAMSVIDLLPHCVSGVYFIYHEDFEKWSFGKLSALREAALALEGGYQFYYMGYYIHSCVKMRYKGDYRPQHVLDPETNKWDPLEPEVKQLLEKKKFVSLSREQRLNHVAPDTSETGETDEIDVERMDADDYDYTSPREAAEAVESGLSLFSLRMPGVMTLEEVMTQVDLGKISINLGGRMLVKMEDLVAFEGSSPLDPHSLKGLIAEFVACIGPTVAKEMVVKLST